MADDDSGINARLAVQLSADLSQLRKAFLEAGKAADGALLGIEQRGQRTKERLERNIELIRLTQQLDIARVSGNSKMVDKLSEEVLLRKTINGLIGQGVKATEAQAIAQEHVAAMAVASKSNEGFGGVAKSIVGSTRVATLEEGGARLGIYGGTLEKLGPIGIGAAAGLAVAGIAIEQVNKAVEHLVELNLRSEKLGIGTDQLQALDAQAHVAEVTTQQLDAGLGALAETLGKLQSGVRIKRIQPWLDQLGISQGDIDKAKTAADLMDLLASKLDGYSTANKRAILSGLGVSAEIIPLLNMEKSKRDEINATIAKYKVPPEMISAIRDQNEKLNEQHEIIDAKLRKDWADLYPLVMKLREAWLGVQNAAAGALSTKPPETTPDGTGRADFKPRDYSKLLRPFQNWASGGEVDEQDQKKTEQKQDSAKSHDASVARTRAETTLTNQLKDEVSVLVDHHQHLEALNTKIASYIADLDKAGSTVPKLPNGQYDESKLSPANRAMVAQLRAAASKEDSTSVSKKAAGVDKDDVAAIHSATIKYLEAQTKNTGDLDKLHALNLMKINQTADDTQKELRDKLKAGSITQGAYSDASGTNERTRAQDIANEALDDQIARAKKAQDASDAQAQMDVSMLLAKAATVRSAQERASLEMQAFQRQQDIEAANADLMLREQVLRGQKTQEQANQLAWERMQTQAYQRAAKQKETDDAASKAQDDIAKDASSIAQRIATAQANLADNTEARVAAERKALQDRQSAEMDAQRKKVTAGTADPSSIGALGAAQGDELQVFDKQHQTPWNAWVTQGREAAANVGTAIQSEATKAIDGFNAGVADAIVNGKNLGQTMAGIFKQMEVALIQYLLKQAELSVFGGGPSNSGGAGGGNFLSSVASVFAAAIPKFAGGTDDAPGGIADVGEHGSERVMLPKGSKVIPHNVLSGLNSSATKAMEVSATHIYEGPQFVLHNPVVTQDLLDQANAFASQRAAHAAVAGAMGGRQLTMSKLATQNRNRMR